MTKIAISRRSFVRSSAALSAAAVLGPRLAFGADPSIARRRMELFINGRGWPGPTTARPGWGNKQTHEKDASVAAGVAHAARS